MNRRPPHLTVREEEILRAIRHSIRDRGEALSVGQPARELGLRRPASAAYHLANLEERGGAGPRRAQLADLQPDPLARSARHGCRAASWP
ncbi:hypothetical protein ACGFZJ_42295 [Streptomyces sp. NPDC048253]|uniref:LexA family protein n=1 Tax=Streptomyces sp. NPDC048253 TaxID=3365524 RepID=UPI00371CD5ED